MGSYPATGRSSEIRSRSEERPTSGPLRFAEILATAATTVASEPRPDGDFEVIPADAPDRLDGELRTWLLHETQSLREPMYRTEARDANTDVPGAGTEPKQLPLIKYEYDSGIAVLSQMGELTARDLRVMAVISQYQYSTMRSERPRSVSR